MIQYVVLCFYLNSIYIFIYMLVLQAFILCCRVIPLRLVNNDSRIVPLDKKSLRLPLYLFVELSLELSSKLFMFVS